MLTTSHTTKAGPFLIRNVILVFVSKPLQKCRNIDVCSRSLKGDGEKPSRHGNDGPDLILCCYSWFMVDVGQKRKSQTFQNVKASGKPEMPLVEYCLTREHEWQRHRTPTEQNTSWYVPWILMFSKPFQKCSKTSAARKLRHNSFWHERHIF